MKLYHGSQSAQIAWREAVLRLLTNLANQVSLRLRIVGVAISLLLCLLAHASHRTSALQRVHKSIRVTAQPKAVYHICISIKRIILLQEFVSFTQLATDLAQQRKRNLKWCGISSLF